MYESTYQSFLIRMAQEPPQTHRTASLHKWHIDVRDIKSGEHHIFACIDDLLAFLREQSDRLKLQSPDQD